jgi:phosphonate transport system ATP-binding protein
VVFDRPANIGRIWRAARSPPPAVDDLLERGRPGTEPLTRHNQPVTRPRDPPGVVLEIRDLQVVYPNGYRALASVDLTVREGEVVALIGRSGAGKSTLLRCVNGLQPAVHGSIRLDGRELTSLGQAELRALRRRIGFVWQEHNLVGRLSVMSNVLTGRLGHGDRLPSLVHYFGRTHREVALRSLERVNLLHRATQRADRLSGGERQRVSIARALAQEPRLILADEPVASLDVELAWQVMSDLVRVARDERVPALISIHQVDLARALVDRVVGIAQGVVAFDGHPGDLDEVALDRVYRFDRFDHLAARRPEGPAPVPVGVLT